MAPKYYFIDQRSDDWDQLHLGIPTASEFSKIITPGGKKSEQWKTYANRLIAEKILKRQVEFAIADSPWMQRGQELESQAVLEYETQFDVDTQPIGFVTTKDGLIGCSPDRLVGDIGLLELKCPAPHTQIGYLVDRKVEEKYKPQTQGQLFITEREWVDVFAYHPELPFVPVRTWRDDVFIKCLEAHLANFNEYIADSIISIADRMKNIRRKPDAIEQLLGEV